VIIPDEIIVLGTTDFAEKSLVIHCLSKTWGRRGFLVRNASKCSGFFQPLSIIACTVIENPKSSLFCAKDFSSVMPLNGIRNSIAKNSMSIFIAEVLFRALREGMDEQGLYGWCKEEIVLLDSLCEHYSNFHIRFLLDFAAACGFRPSVEDIMPFIGDQAEKTIELMKSEAADSLLVPMTGTQRSAICERLIKYLEFHLDTKINVKSLKVLSELLNF